MSVIDCDFSSGDVRQIQRPSPKGAPANEPLKTLQEMAERFSVSPKALARRLKGRSGPSSALVARNSGGVVKYYRPTPLRKWWDEKGCLTSREYKKEFK